MGHLGGSTGQLESTGAIDLGSTFRLRFVAEHDVVSGAVRWFEGHDVGPSHVDIVLPDGTYLGARASGGVAIRQLDYIKPEAIVWERRYAIPVEPEQLGKIYTFALAQVGKGYDFSDIFGIALHTNWNNKDAWMCSELALASAYSGEVWMLNVQPGFTHRIDPGRLHLSPRLRGHCYYTYVKS